MSAGPNLVVVGAGKAGSTSLYRYLLAHPEIFGSKIKELMYFSNRYDKGHDWYESHFLDGRSAKVRFEASPQYSFVDEYPDVAARIARYAPDMKIMYIVREPVERLVSHFNHWARTKPDAYFDIDEALSNPAKRRFLVERTKYWKQISAYRKHFADEQIKVVFLEDLVSDFATTMSRVWEFLDLPPLEGQVERAVVHNSHPGDKRASRTSINREIHQNLVSELRGDIRTFLDFYGKPVEFWGEEYAAL